MRDTRFSTCSIRYQDTTVQLTHRSGKVSSGYLIGIETLGLSWEMCGLSLEWDTGRPKNGSSFLSLPGLGFG